MIQLIIGISIGTAIGILLTIMAMPKNNDATQLEDFVYEEDQVHESGFIDIPIQRLVSEKRMASKRKSVIGIRKRLQRFKERNQFYR